ncbi:AraC family transcriptional regulator [Corynebacterium sp. S7]
MGMHGSSGAAELARAWKPAVPKIHEVLREVHRDHAYPVHSHSSWSLMEVDRGAVAYELDGRTHHIPTASLALLPPRVPHTGRSAARGKQYAKTSLYLDEEWLPTHLTGASVDTPLISDPQALRTFRRLTDALQPGDQFAAEVELATLCDQLSAHLGAGSPAQRDDVPLARRFRSLLDDHLPHTPTLEEAAAELNTHPSHLSRSFSKAFGISPHRYVISLRVEHARTLLLKGLPLGEVALQSGFYDQAHLTRHFRSLLGTTPGRFASN